MGKTLVFSGTRSEGESSSEKGGSGNKLEVAFKATPRRRTWLLKPLGGHLEVHSNEVPRSKQGYRQVRGQRWGRGDGEQTWMQREEPAKG